jgi:anthraniloyl-CoA monooxygenase
MRPGEGHEIGAARHQDRVGVVRLIDVADRHRCHADLVADAVEIAEAFRNEGADLIDVSAGQTSTDAQPIYGRMFQTPFSDKLRNEGRLATMAVGNIYEPDHANSILAAGRADLVALARPHLIDPFWTLRAAAALDYRDNHVPPQYLNGQAQLARNLKREAEAAAAALRA